MMALQDEANSSAANSRLSVMGQLVPKVLATALRAM